MKRNEKSKEKITNEIIVSINNNDTKMYYKQVKYLLTQYLTCTISKILDLRELEKHIFYEGTIIENIINKYAKQNRNEKDIKEMFKKQNNILNLVSNNFLQSVIELIDIIYNLLNGVYIKSFKKELPDFEDFYEFDIEDMVFVNGILKELKKYKSSNINEKIIFYAINKAIKEYVYCIDNNIDYSKCFDRKDTYITINKINE